MSLVAEDECPNCHNGTLGLESGKLVCRGECGEFFEYTIKCRYSDCIEQHPVANDNEQVTCNICREYMGLPQ